MMNNIMLVGRLTNNLEMKELESGNKFTEMVLAVNRSFKNSDGIYETDLIPVIVWEGISKQVAEYCGKGDTIGVRGRLQMDNDRITVIAERVTFLSSRKDLPKSEE